MHSHVRSEGGHSTVGEVASRVFSKAIGPLNQHALGRFEEAVYLIGLELTGALDRG